MNSNNIDDVLGEDYVLENAIEGDGQSIDDASVNDDVLMNENGEPAVETIDLTLVDTDEEDENEYSTGYSLRARRRLRKGNASVFRRTSAPAAGINRTITDDTDSVESRFSDAGATPKKTARRELPLRAAATKKKAYKKTKISKAKKNRTNPKKRTKVVRKKRAATATSVAGVSLSNKECKPLLVTDELEQRFYLMELSDFDSRIRVRRRKPSNDDNDIIERKMVENGVEYQLFCSKFEKRDSKDRRRYDNDDSK